MEKSTCIFITSLQTPYYEWSKEATIKRLVSMLADFLLIRHQDLLRSLVATGRGKGSELI